MRIQIFQHEADEKGKLHKDRGWKPAEDLYILSEKPASAKPDSKLFSNVGKPRPSLSLHKNQGTVNAHKKLSTSKSCKPLKEVSNEDVNAPAGKFTQVLASERGDQKASGSLRKKEDAINRKKLPLQLQTATLEQPTTPEKTVLTDKPCAMSPEVMVIPDTPECKGERKQPKPVCRSFLCSASSLTTMPGQKPLPNRAKPRKVLKKSSGLVSVEFGKQVMSENTECNPVLSFDESVLPVVDLTEDGEQQSLTVNASAPAAVQVNQAMCEKKVSDCIFMDSSSEVIQTEKKMDVELHQIATVEATTPTKLYSDGKSIKRMSKKGLSPDPKRTLDVQSNATLKNDMQNDLSVHSRAVKAKRQLAAMSVFKDVKELNKSANTYQLGGNTRESHQEMEASCEGDDVLADILGQMVDKPTQQHQHAKKTQGQQLTVIPDSQVDGISETEREAATDAESENLLDDILEELQSKPVKSGGYRSEKPVRNTEDRASKCRKDDTGTDVVQTKIKEKSSVSAARAETSNALTGTVLSTDQCGPCASPVADLAKGVGAGEGRTSKCLKRDSSGGLPGASEQELEDHCLSSDVEDALAGSFSQMSPFKRTCSKHNTRSTRFTDQWNRFIVQSVSYNQNAHEIHLELQRDTESKDQRLCILQGFWADTHIEAGDIVHVLTDDGLPGQSRDGVIVISDTQGQIVVNPDLLLSGTVVVSGVHCLRRSVLNEKFKGIDGKNVHMLYGSIIHSLFQEAVRDRLSQRSEIVATAQSVIGSAKFLHEMFGQGVSEEKVMEEVEGYIEPLQAWQQKYMDVGDKSSFKRQPSEVNVVQIHDIEETIWSPRFGVKGKIDMTVEVKLQNDRGQITQKVLPLELKTGKATHSVEHKGQVTLYSMMTSDRREDPGEGLLLYLKHSDMKVIPVKPQSKQGLLQLRNEMAYYLSRQIVKSTGEDGHVTYHLGRLPTPINSQRSCSKCPHLTNCAIYQKAVEGLEHREGHAMRQLVPEALSHLSPSHLTYFTHWLLCMDLEMASERSRGLRNIWCMSSDEREKQGDCLQQMVIVDTVLGVPETQAFTEGQGCCVLFQRKPGFQGSALNAVGLSKNDSVVISSEDGRLIALSTGFIKDVSDSVVEVVVDRDSFHENAAFQPLVFRIDRCDAFNTAGYLLSNLSRLMESTPHCSKLRSLIIDGKKPEFNLTMSKTAVEKVKGIFKCLNKPQKTAVLKVLMSKDFVLIKGYPGTGKTSTIVALVKILKELGHSVLLTSYTHSAVDNILLKLKKDGVPFLRLGRSSRIHPQIQDHAAETLTLDIKSVAELRDFYNFYAIVATSCLGTNHPVFTQRKFDVCIVDEASQVLQPACLGPLFHASRFVLVGDPQQLPPVVQSKEASGLGMEESLFVRLDGAGATFDLNLQYRMNSSIMQLSNELVYQGALKCGSPAVAEACIQPDSTALEEEWEYLHRALDSSLSNAVLFLDTSKISAPERSDGRGLLNEMEASIILTLCSTFVQAGIPREDIGVIAPYRSQVKHLQHLLGEHSLLDAVEVNTVDQYQGRDKSVILISFVRSSSTGDAAKKGGLLQDIRRLNVAVTRAKHKLVLVGNSVTLTHYQPVRTLLQNIQGRQQMYTLPTDFQLPEVPDS